MLVAFRINLPGKSIGQSDVRTIWIFFVGGVFPDVADQKIQQPVAIVIEEHGACGMGDDVDPGLFGDVREMAVAVVVKKVNSAADGGDDKILIAVIVDICESGANADDARQCDAGLGGDVLKLAAAKIFPKRISANLIQEEQIVAAVAIHIGCRHCTAVIVVNSFVVLQSIRHGLITKSDSAFRELVREMKPGENFELAKRFALGLSARRQSARANIRLRKQYLPRRV